MERGWALDVCHVAAATDTSVVCRYSSAEVHSVLGRGGENDGSYIPTLGTSVKGSNPKPRFPA